MNVLVGNKNEDKVLVVATEEETVCSLCLEKAGKWFVVDMCGCRFCQQVYRFIDNYFMVRQQFILVNSLALVYGVVHPFWCQKRERSTGMSFGRLSFNVERTQQTFIR